MMLQFIPKVVFQVEVRSHVMLEQEKLFSQSLKAYNFHNSPFTGAETQVLQNHYPPLNQTLHLTQCRHIGNQPFFWQPRQP